MKTFSGARQECQMYKEGGRSSSGSETGKSWLHFASRNSRALHFHIQSINAHSSFAGDFLIQRSTVTTLECYPKLPPHLSLPFGSKKVIRTTTKHQMLIQQESVDDARVELASPYRTRWIYACLRIHMDQTTTVSKCHQPCRRLFCH